MLFKTTFIVLVFIVHFVISNIKHSSNKQLVSTNTQQIPTNEIVLTDSNFNSREEKVCTDIDVRNYVSNFDVLRGCTVVEGYVQINLIDTTTYQDFGNLSFPELREITEYLLFYHVSGLKSIGSLFPNLSLIRGHGLIWEYTFSIFTMPNLQEIQLPRLTHIMKGTIIISKNPGLCYVKTVDWKKIAKKSNIVITDNKSLEECNRELDIANVVDCEYYWAPNVCQMAKELEKCHPLCAGGCNGTTANDCFVCIGVVYNGECLHKCPPDLYNYMSRRCLTKEECLNNKRITSRHFPDGMRMSYSPNAQWKPFNGSCIDECPPGYNSTDDGTNCEQCSGMLCPKVCNGISVKSIDQAREVKGCTFINGSIEIQIQTGDSEIVAQELEKGLGMITEISGHLKLSHSLPVQSLNFLKRLRIIHGDSSNEESSIHSNYSLIVWDNPNLQELWDWTLKPEVMSDVPKFEIRKGKILFHDNPKLCIEKIYELVNITKNNIDTFDVLKESNGYEFACGASNLTLNVLNKTDVSLYLQVSEQKKVFDNDQRYVLYYVQTENGNYTNFDTVGNCAASGWKFKDISTSKDRTCNVTDLEPASEYAFFVKIYHSKRIQRSNITFHTTLPARPSVPVQFQVIGKNQSSITLSWLPPKHPHGILEKYIVKMYFQKYDKKFLDTRNYCEWKLIPTTESTFLQSRLIKKPKTRKIKNCCEKDLSCDLDHESFHYVTSQQQLIQTCDNYISTYLQYNDIHSNFDFGFDPNMQNLSTVAPSPDRTIDIFVPNTSVVVSDLNNFNTIVFVLSACRQVFVDDHFLLDDPIEERCSDEPLLIAQTERDPRADEIPPQSVKFNLVNASTLQLNWSFPVKPNGIIVNFFIAYKRNGILNAEICRTRKQIEEESGIYLHDLPSGNYLFKIQAVSLAGEGPWTDWFPWVVQSSDHSSLYVVLVFIVIIITFSMLAVIIFLMYLQKKKLEKRAKDGTLFASVNPEYVKVPYVADEWEMERSDVELRNVLGKGTFGIVHEGFIKSKNMKCAVKTIMDTATDRDRLDFLNEATTMKTFSSAHNIVGLLGVVSQGHPPLILIELMELGDLKTFLRNTRDSEKTPPPPSLILIKMAAQIADGMEYMEARKYVHRDLAARNCMVAQDLSVKIGDLGMSRDIYQHDYYRKSGKGLMPVRWMAPESLNDGVFTSYSDVWSYGIVLWEMTMLAEQPYQGYSNEEVLQFVISGKTLNDLSMPVYCPDVLKNIMLRSWIWRPSSRPTFHEIINSYEEYLDGKFRSTSFHHSEECYEMRMIPKPTRPKVTTTIAEIDSDLDMVQTESASGQVVFYHKSNEARAASTNSNGEMTKKS